MIWWIGFSILFYVLAWRKPNIALGWRRFWTLCFTGSVLLIAFSLIALFTSAAAYTSGSSLPSDKQLDAAELYMDRVEVILNSYPDDFECDTIQCSLDFTARIAALAAPVGCELCQKFDSAATCMHQALEGVQERTDLDKHWSDFERCSKVMDSL